MRLADDPLRVSGAGLFRDLFEKAADPMLLLEGGVFIDCNAAAVAMLGCASKAEVIGRSPAALSPERQPDGQRSVDKQQEVTRRSIAADGHRFEWTHRRADGTTFTVEVLLTALGPERPDLVFTIWRDLTQQKRTDLILQQAQAALRQANLTLEQRVEERTRELERRRRVAESLRDTLKVLNSNLPLPDILNAIVAQAQELMEASACLLHQYDGARSYADLVAYAGLPEPLAGNMGFSALTPSGRSYWERISSRQLSIRAEIPPELIQQVTLDMAPAPALRPAFLAALARYRSFLGIPLIIKDGVYGALAFFFERPRTLDDEEINIASTFAEQAALAIENARLRARAEQMAAEAERGRLARDLHDSVTQTLFSASLIAEVLPRLWRRDPASALEQVEAVRLLTRGALAEMRTLLLELRPAALMQAELHESLRHLVDASAARGGIPVTLEARGRAPLAAEVKVALYRIAQEALNNVVKHAEASSARVTLDAQAGAAQLAVVDDGRGFRPEAVSPQHLGLGIMAERAHSINACLEVYSAPGEGTQIIVTWIE